MAGPNVITRTRAGASRRWKRAKAQHRWIEHFVVAYKRFTENNGNQYAAAITYFSFLAIFPLILLGVSIAGFVLSSGQITDLKDNVASAVPGDFGKTIGDAIDAAVTHRGSIGLVGLVGVLLTGLGWIGNLRAAYNAVWGAAMPKRNVFKAKLADLLVLFGLGVGLIISLGITAVGTALSGRVLSATGLDSIPGAQFLASVVGLAVAVAADVLILGWLLVELPATEVRFRFVWRGALLGAIGLELLKVGATYLLAGITKSPAVGVFGSSIVLLVFINYVSRWLLFVAAWTATGMTPVQASAAVLDRGEPPRSTDPGARAAEPAVLSPLGLATSLVGVGAALGGAAVAALTVAGGRRRRATASDSDAG